MTGESSEMAAASRHGIPRRQLRLGVAVFLLLTVGVFGYQFFRVQAGDAAPRWGELRWSYLALILLCLPVETLASAARIWVLCRALRPGMSLWTCLQAEWANAGLAILTPSQSGGGAGQIYMLTRGGATVATAVTVSLLSFVGTMVGLFGMGLYVLLFARIEPGMLFAGSAWSLTAIAVTMGGAALRPSLFRVPSAALSRVLCRIAGRADRLMDWWPPAGTRTGAPVDRMDRLAAMFVDVVYSFRDDVRRFLRHGKAGFLGVCVLSLSVLLSRCLTPYLCARFLGLDVPSLGRVIEAQMILVFLVFFAPTPGGAGVAEAASLSIMADLVPAGYAPYYNLLWRFSTAYWAAIAGLLCLSRALVYDARRLVVARRSEESARPDAPAARLPGAAAPVRCQTRAPDNDPGGVGSPLARPGPSEHGGTQPLAKPPLQVPTTAGSPRA